jgi:hypothetical protein
VQSAEDFDEQGWIWETRVIPDDQEVKAMPMASFDGSRSCGAPAIARRKFIWRQRDPIDEAFIVLEKKKGYKHVRELCGSQREEGCRAEIKTRSGRTTDRRRSRSPLAARRFWIRVAWRL